MCSQCHDRPESTKHTHFNKYITKNKQKRNWSAVGCRRGSKLPLLRPFLGWIAIRLARCLAHGIRRSLQPLQQGLVPWKGHGKQRRRSECRPRKKHAKSYINRFPDQSRFFFLQDVRQNLHIGLDLDRFCILDRIIEKSTPIVFYFVAFSAEICVEYYHSGRK